jgi:hypothetical protein
MSRGSGQLKRTPLNKVSKKKKKQNSEIEAAYKRHYADPANRVCACCGTDNGLSIHHKKGRGPYAADETTFVTLCTIGDFLDRLHPTLNHSHAGGCHGFVEGNKKWARENGYLET